MLDLSVPFNLSAFVAFLAVILAWSILLIDVFAVRSGGKRIKTAALTLGIVGLVLSCAAGFIILGLKVGFITILGDGATVFSLAIPHIARLTDLFNAPVVWGLTGGVLALSVALIVGAATIGKRVRPQVASEGPAAEENESEGGRETVAEEERTEADGILSDNETEAGARDAADGSDGEKAEDAAADDGGYRVEEVAATVAEHLSESDALMGDMRDMMDEISGLVDSLENGGADAEERGDSEVLSDGEEFAPDESENIDSADYFRDFADDSDEAEETAEAENEAKDRSEENAVARGGKDESGKEALKEPSEEAKAAAAVVEAEKLSVRTVILKGMPSEVENYTTLPHEDGEAAQESAAPKPRTIVRSEGVREVRAMESGLPMNRKHVLMNRRNVVNMFSEYLSSKSKEEKERIENSINTIIIK